MGKAPSVPSRVPTVLYVGEDHCAGLLGGVLYMLVHTDPRPDIIERQARWIARMKAEAPLGSAFLVVIRSGARPPSPTVRNLIRRGYHEFAKVVVAGALVVEGTGFAGAVQRSVLTMVIAAGRVGPPIRVFSSVRAACGWLMATMGTRSGSDALALALAIETTRVAALDGTLSISGPAAQPA